MTLIQSLDKSKIAYSNTKTGRYYCAGMACYFENKGKFRKIKNFKEIVGLDWKPMGVNIQ